LLSQWRSAWSGVDFDGISVFDVFHECLDEIGHQVFAIRSNFEAALIFKRVQMKGPHAAKISGGFPS